MTKMMKMILMAMARPMLMITRRLGVGGRDVALFTGLWQQRDCGAEEDFEDHDEYDAREDDSDNDDDDQNQNHFAKGFSAAINCYRSKIVVNTSIL